MRSDLPDGLMRDLFGQVVAPVKVIPSQEKEKVQVTPSVTSSPIGSGSSKSVSLQQSLANRLRERLASGGSMQSQQILSLKTTPLRRAYCQDSLSERITKGNGFGSWPTPTALSGGAGDWRNNKRGDQSGNALKTAASTWPTPTVSDKKGTSVNRLQKDIEKKNLRGVVHLSGKKLTGQKSSGSSVTTKKPDRSRLNPAFSLWLMGYPQSWIERAIPTTTPTQKPFKESGTQLFPKSEQNL